ncbi:MAG: hypothetical protein JSV05_00280 [Candidatus Bathyarchaeota archaeon]|nr:MAG: hypothetical protein JSV05_00280 [Candidatus Bathyarchaeota archaeon]
MHEIEYSIVLEETSRRDKACSDTMLLGSKITKKLLILLPTLIVTLIVASSVAISGPTYTWEKTFEVTKPEIECEIEISDCRVVGCPVKVRVMLKLGNDCGRSWHECKECDISIYDIDGDGNLETMMADCHDITSDDIVVWDLDDWWSEELPFRRKICIHHWEDECCYQINGTYAVQLYWWNETHEDWQHLMYLQEETNITLGCLPPCTCMPMLVDVNGDGILDVIAGCINRCNTLMHWFRKTYTFIPSMEGEYKVVVTFTTETETFTYSSED